jgi:hypothetical protein
VEYPDSKLRFQISYFRFEIESLNIRFYSRSFAVLNEVGEPRIDANDRE